MNRIVVGLTVLIILGSTTICFADGIIIPVSIKVEEFKKEIKSKGIDLYGRDDSDGEIQNNGNKIKIITYKPTTIEQMELMKEVAFKTVRK